MLSVINVLMQLRKVCNHPNLFEPRPTISPFQMEALTYSVPRSVFNVLEYDPFKVKNYLFHIFISIKIILCFNRKLI